MAEAKEKKVKPKDPVEVVMNNKFYKPGQKVSVHENVADKLINSGKAFASEAEYKKNVKAAGATGKGGNAGTGGGNPNDIEL